MSATPLVQPRDGFALVLSILLLLALTMLSAGMVAVAGQESRIAAAVAARFQARADAEAAVRRALSTWSTRRERTLPPGSARTVPHPGRAELRVERLDSSLFLVTATATVPAGRAHATASAGALVRALLPEDLVPLAATAAAVAGKAAVPGGTVSGADACGSRPDRPGLLASDTGQTGGTLEGDPPLLVRPRRPDLLDRLPFGRLPGVAVDRPVGTPEPIVRAGACVPGPWNWRTAEAGHPCRTPVLIHSTGDLTLRGGRGFGVLVVDGDLVLSGGFAFDGLVLVRGRLRLDEGAIRGALRAGELELRNGDIRYDACLLSDAFRAPAFDQAFRPPGRWWVPVF